MSYLNLPYFTFVGAWHAFVQSIQVSQSYTLAAHNKFDVLSAACLATFSMFLLFSTLFRAGLEQGQFNVI